LSYVHGAINMLGLAQTIVSLTGSRSDIIFKPLPKDDPLQRKPDISLAEKHLAWHPDISLKDGLIKTIAYFKQIHGLFPTAPEPHASAMENT
jgi:UDP-glucuronate decarboxylase